MSLMKSFESSSLKGWYFHGKKCSCFLSPAKILFISSLKGFLVSELGVEEVSYVLGITLGKSDLGGYKVPMNEPTELIGSVGLHTEKDPVFDGHDPYGELGHVRERDTAVEGKVNFGPA